MITETLFLNVSDSALKVVFLSTLYADVKEPAPDQRPGTGSLSSGISSFWQTQNGRSCFLIILDF
jgi:hypothetical protein